VLLYDEPSRRDGKKRAKWWATGPAAETQLGEKKPKPGPASRGSPKNSHPRDSSRRLQASLAQMHHLARVEIH